MRSSAVGTAPVRLVEPNLLGHFIIGQSFNNRFLHCLDPFFPLPLGLGCEAETIECFLKTTHYQFVF